MNFKLYLETLQAFRNKAPMGDVATLKLAALQEPNTQLIEKLRKVSAYAPELTFAALDKNPEGSMGAEYAKFLRTNQLEHLDISPSILERFANDPYPVRFTVTHDLHHLLTGFDTGIAGEMGVFAFMVGQGSAPGGFASSRAVRWLYPLVSPSQAATIRYNYDLGVRMGKRAKLVIAEPLESWVAEPLDVVRKRLGIDTADIAQVRKSGHSWLIDQLYSKLRNDKPSAVVN